nr:hypothetical protein [Tanacetum cinerariifolium]
MLDIVGFVVGLINNMTFMNVTVFNRAWFFGENLIWIESDHLTFNDAIYHDMFQFKKSTNVVKSMKIDAIWSLSFIKIFKRCKVPLVYKNGLTIVWNFEDLIELSESKSYEFMLNHKRDEKIAIVTGFVERVMRLLALIQTRRPQSDHGKACRSVFSSSSHHQGMSSHQHDDDDDIKTSRATTPSPTTYLNSLRPLDHQNYHVPSFFAQTDETLFA